MLPAVKPLMTLYAEQHEGCPDIIEKLNGNEQNPQRNLVLLRPDCESDAIMSNKHSEQVGIKN